MSFFAVTPEDAYSILDCIAQISGTECRLKRLEPTGHEVIDDRHIEYDGETTSLSALARKLKGFDHQVQRTLWFSYEGEILNDRRMRFETHSYNI